MDLSAHFRCSHVSLPHIWLKWGAKGSGSSASNAGGESGALAMEDTEFLDSAGNGGREAFDILDEDALARVANPSLPAPYAASSAAVAEKVKGKSQLLFYSKYCCNFVFDVLLSYEYSIDLFERIDGNDKMVAGGDANEAARLSGDQLAEVIQRMGQLVLGVKTLFDSKCSPKKNTVLTYDVPGKILTASFAQWFSCT